MSGHLKFVLQKESTYNTVRPSSPAYDNLVRFAPMEPDKMVPDPMEKWEYSPNRKVLTFTLRQGVKFHNGNDFTSADVKFTLNRIRGAITEGPGALGLAAASDAKERVVVSPIACRFVPSPCPTSSGG